MSEGGSPSISIVVPVRNGGPALRSCLMSMAACVPPPAEIIVVDDASTDASASIAADAGAITVRLFEQKGPAHARNRGAERARGDLLFFVDADVVLQPDATAQVLDAFTREPQLGAVFGSYDDDPAAQNFLSQYKNLAHHWFHQRGRADASTFWAGCGAVRRDVFARLGGFDESYRRASIEDIEFGSRARRRGCTVRLRKSLQVKHLKRWTPTSLLLADIRDRALPWGALSLRDGLVDDLNLRWSSRLAAVTAQAGLVTLVAHWWWPSSVLLTVCLAAVLLLLDAPLYSFFRRKRGLVFAARCFLWHWLYYLYASTAFAFAVLRHQWNAHARADAS